VVLTTQVLIKIIKTIIQRGQSFDKSIFLERAKHRKAHPLTSTSAQFIIAIQL